MKINLNGLVGWDFTAETIREKINGYNGDVDLYVNSEGGDLYTGLEIFNEIRKYQNDTGSKIAVYFSGFVASAASYFSMAAKERIAYDNSVFMIHNSATSVYGDRKALQYWADDLERTDKVIAATYARATGKSEKEMRALMDAGESNSGSYFYGQEILDEGFATSIITTEENKDKENTVNEKKMLFANYKKNVKPMEYDHERIVALVKDTGIDMNENKPKGAEKVNKEEVLKALSVHKENGALTLSEIAEHLGLQNQLITSDQKTNLAEYEKAKKLCGDKPVSDFIASLQSTMKENAERDRNARLDELFGPIVNPVNKAKNNARMYAEVKLGDSELTDEKVNEVKKDELFKKLIAEHADANSEWNAIGEIEQNGKTNTTENTGGVKVRRV